MPPKVQYIIPAVVAVILVVLGIIFWITLLSKASRNFKEPEVATTAISPESAARPLAEYYIKSSYNSCAAGDYQNDYVTLAALENAISNGCRFLDFEIYDIDDDPVVAVSTTKDVTFKGTFNSIPMFEVFKTLKSKAFTVSNGRDPLFLQFRFKTDHTIVCNKVATLIRDNFGDMLLPNKYNYSYPNNNLGKEPLNIFIGKVAIISDTSNPIVNKSALAEFVNLGANSIYNRVLSHSELALNAPSDILDYSKKYMLTCVPELTRADNDDSSVGFNQGAQINAMKFQTQDSNLAAYISKFEGYAFLLKPVDLQYVPVMADEAPALPPTYNYGTVLNNVAAGSAPFNFSV